MKYRVKLSGLAEADLLELHLYVEQNDSPQRADDLLAALEEVILALGTFPERGHVPPELERIGIREYRELHCKAYRIVYRIENGEVIVHGVLDGRRDMRTLLEQRMLR